MSLNTLIKTLSFDSSLPYIQASSSNHFRNTQKPPRQLDHDTVDKLSQASVMDPRAYTQHFRGYTPISYCSVDTKGVTGQAYYYPHTSFANTPQLNSFPVQSPYPPYAHPIPGHAGLPPQEEPALEMDGNRIANIVERREVETLGDEENDDPAYVPAGRPRAKAHPDRNANSVVEKSKRQARREKIEAEHGSVGALDAPKGKTKTTVNGLMWWDKPHKAWIPAAPLDVYRQAIIIEDDTRGSYDIPPAHGKHHHDITTFATSCGQQHWNLCNRSTWSNIQDHEGNQVMYLLDKPVREEIPSPGFMYYNRLLMLDPDDNPIKDWPGAPRLLSSQAEGGRMEALRRVYGMTIPDLRARMPRMMQGRESSWKPLFQLSTFNHRMARFRDAYECPAWLSREPNNSQKTFTLMRLAESGSTSLTTAGLTVPSAYERERRKAVNKGKYPEKAGTRALSKEERARRAKKDAEHLSRLEKEEVVRRRVPTVQPSNQQSLPSYYVPGGYYPSYSPSSALPGSDAQPIPGGYPQNEYASSDHESGRPSVLTIQTSVNQPMPVTLRGPRGLKRKLDQWAGESTAALETQQGQQRMRMSQAAALDPRLQHGYSPVMMSCDQAQAPQCQNALRTQDGINDRVCGQLATPPKSDNQDPPQMITNRHDENESINGFDFRTPAPPLQDLRFVKPQKFAEQLSIKQALLYTRFDFLRYHKEEALHTSNGDSYNDQYLQIQTLHESKWSEPWPAPILIGIGEWLDFNAIPLPNLNDEFAEDLLSLSQPVDDPTVGSPYPSGNVEGSTNEETPNEEFPPLSQSLSVARGSQNQVAAARTQGGRSATGTSDSVHDKVSESTAMEKHPSADGPVNDDPCSWVGDVDEYALSQFDQWVGS